MVGNKMNQPILMSTAIIRQHYAFAIINDDWSGLEPHAIKQLKGWLDTLPRCHHITINDDSDETLWPSLQCDEVSGLLAECVEVSIWG